MEEGAFEIHSGAGLAMMWCETGDRVWPQGSFQVSTRSRQVVPLRLIRPLKGDKLGGEDHVIDVPVT